MICESRAGCGLSISSAWKLSQGKFTKNLATLYVEISVWSLVSKYTSDYSSPRCITCLGNSLGPHSEN